MPVWDFYPENYRQNEIQTIVNWISSGESVAVIGLSGSGKSNLLGFLANRRGVSDPAPALFLADCNRLVNASREGFFRFLLNVIDGSKDNPISPPAQEFDLLVQAINQRIQSGENLSILIDRFDSIFEWQDFDLLAGNLRSLRDAFKFQLTFVIAARHPVDEKNELAELFFGHTLWLGPLARSDAIWSARRDIQRFSGNVSVQIDDEILDEIVAISWGYPSFLRAVCEAYSEGAPLEIESLRNHASVIRRVREFWLDQPDEELLQKTRLMGHPFLAAGTMEPRADFRHISMNLTLKENLLLEYLRSHEDEVCEKDQLIRSVWPEDVVFDRGIRDESLAQLVRRLRVKIEKDPADPQFIQTVPGRGYLFRSGREL